MKLLKHLFTVQSKYIVYNLWLHKKERKVCCVSAAANSVMSARMPLSG